MGFKVPLARRAFAWTAFLCVLLWGLVFLAYFLFGRYIPEKQELWELIRALGVSRASLYLIGAYVIVINPFLEELFWRGYVQSFLMNGCSSCRTEPYYLKWNRMCGRHLGTFKVELRQPASGTCES